MIDELYTARFCEEFERQNLRERRTVYWGKLSYAGFPIGHN